MRWSSNIIGVVCLLPLFAFAKEPHSTCVLHANTYAQAALMHHFGPITEDQAIIFLRDSYRTIPITEDKLNELIFVIREAFINEKGFNEKIWRKYYDKCMETRQWKNPAIL